MGLEGGRSFFFNFLKATVEDDGQGMGLGGWEELTTSGQAGQRIRTKTANLSRQGKGFTTTTTTGQLTFY